MKLHRVIQQFERPRVEDIQRTVESQLAGCGVKISRGASIAVAAGSRGIANLAQITKSVVQFVQRAGANPFIIPAMGSHGGATAEGQAGVLASYGITEQSMGCAVRSSMEVVPLDATGLETKLFMDRFAWESDGVILINRIKLHTDFHGRFESGLVKMCVIGLGKEKQAREMHLFGVHGLRDLVPKAAERVLATGKILLGVAIVENACEETAVIEALPAANILQREPELLEMASKNMARLPVDELDVLIIDQLGKNISGSGIDTNIIGRIRIDGETEPDSPHIRSIVVTDLTPETHGNACGLGLADVITQRLRDKIDFDVTYTNIITSGFLERGKMPVVGATDREALEIALRGAGCRDPESARIIRVRDTLHLSELLVSSAVLEELRGRPALEVHSPPIPLFDPNGEMRPF